MEWDVAYGALAASIHAWNVWGPLGEALGRGAWHADVSVKFRRDADGNDGQAPVMPSQRLLRYLVTLPGVEMLSPDVDVAVVPRTGPRLGLEPLAMERLIVATRLGGT